MDIKIQKKPSFSVAEDLRNRRLSEAVTDKVKAEKLGLSIKTILAAEYAIVPVKGSIPASIHHAWKSVLEVFFPETGYHHSGAPDFEVYSEGDMSSSDYQMELWIPVMKN